MFIYQFSKNLLNTYYTPSTFPGLLWGYGQPNGPYALVGETDAKYAI